MKKSILILILIFSFSCKNKKEDVPVLESKAEVIEPVDSIVFHKDLRSIEGLDEKQLFSKYFKANKLDSLFLISNQIKPNSFIADFNGDSKKDIVFFVRNVWNNKAGLIFFHSPNDFFIVGGGNNDSALDNVYYTRFIIDDSKITYETVIDSITGDIIREKEIKLKNIALNMKEEEGTSGLLTWNGEQYIYIHTGD